MRVAHASLFNSPLPPPRVFGETAQARPVLPSDLMNGTTRARELGRVPRLIHQSWKDREPPQRFRTWSDSWRRNHPNWSYVLW